MKKNLNNFTAHFVFALLVIAVTSIGADAQKKKPSINAAEGKTKISVTKNKQGQIAAPRENLAEKEIAALAPVKSSRMKICVAAPKTNLMPGESAPESLLNSLVKYLSGPAAEK